MFRTSAVVLASALLLSPAFAKGPQKVKDACKGVKATQDSFGVTRIFESGDLKIQHAGNAWTFLLGFNKGGGFGGFSSGVETIPPGATVDLVYADGSTHTLTTTAQITGTMFYVMGVSSIHYTVPLTLSDDEAKALAASPVKAFRVSRGAEVWNSGEVNEGDAKKVSETLTCMLAN